MEKTLIILKPDAVKRKLVGEILQRIERKNYCIYAMKLEKLSEMTVKEHYKHIETLSIFTDMVTFMTEEPSVLLIIEGQNVISTMRSMIGKTNSFESSAGTIRGDYGSHRFINLIHASDCIVSAELEMKRFFPELFS